MASVTVRKIGPRDNGRRMSLKRFAHAETEGGYLYELGRGVIAVMPLPRLSHGLMVQEVSLQVRAYQRAHPDVVHYAAGGGECGLQLPGMESERHPDQAIYLTPPPADEQPWDQWVPDIVMEVVSRGREAQKRDYEQKREEYLAAGVREYWIIDPRKRAMLVLKRRGDVWQEQRLRRTAVYRTALLPGFKFELESVFAAGERR